MVPDGIGRAAGPLWTRALGCLALALWLGPILVGIASGQASPDRILTVAVLVNSTNTTGFSANPISPGEFQRYPERYLQHLQVPYQLFDVSAGPPPDLTNRQLILAGHRGLNLSAAWQTAISTAVNGGVGFVNLDWDVNVGNQSHIRNIFGNSTSLAGTPGTAITVPAAVRTGGTTPHYIAALQQAFQGDNVGPTGDLIYDFHPDSSNVVRSVTSTLLTGAHGTAIAKIGSDPLILATTFGQGRGVHFGTLDYLRADRFGFVQGVDDLFWRSLVWAARKPFVLRGYPRLWAVQMDDTFDGWGFRIRDLYDHTLTGDMAADGTGGPWKVTGYVFLNHLSPGNSERASVIADINAGLLKVVPHALANTACGDIYWDGPLGRQYTDAEWLSIINQVMQWKLGQGGSDTIPQFSRSMVPHYWSLGDNTGSDLWNTFGYRYVTSILKPGFSRCGNNNGTERPHVRPFWIYEQPPKRTLDEDFAFFFADDYPVNSRAGQAPKTLFLFTTQLQDPGFYSNPDVRWPGPSTGVTASIQQFERTTWRFWSSLAPVQIFTHDLFNYGSAMPSERQDVIRNVSSWLKAGGVRHLFMEDLGDYIYARTKSVLTDARLTGTDVTYVFTGNAATADNTPIGTRLLVFFNDSSDAVSQTVPGFIGGLTVTKPLGSPPPDIASVSPSSGPVAGGTSVTIAGSNFTSVSAVSIGGTAVTGYVVNSATTITATTPAGVTGPADVVVVTASGTGTLPSGFTYLGPPRVTTVDPSFGPVQGGTSIRVTGQGFEPTSTVRVGGTPATGVTFVDSTTLVAVTPAGTAGPAPVQVTNSFGATALSAGFYYGNTIRLNFAYRSRAELVGAGWDFMARTASGVSRDTEQTTGLQVSYDQTAHPGVIRIPVDQGDIYQMSNSSRNTLFFTLPSRWRSMKLKVAQFSPNGDFQQAALVAYQDDDNFVLLTKFSMSGSTLLEFARETGSNYAVVQRVPAPAGAVLFLRLDRDRATETITASYSTDDVTWTALTGSAGLALTNPRLAVLTGANATGNIVNADFEFAEIVAVDDPPVIGATPSSMTFSAVQGGGNPSAQPLAITNDGNGVVNWTAGPDASWLAVSPTSGIAPSNLTVSVNSAGLAAGTYSANITITSSGAANTPRLVPVTLTISPAAPPSITAISPGGGSSAGGTAVQISGSSFTAGTTVTIGGAPATSVAVLSTGKLNALTPAGPAAAADVAVSTTFGTATLPAGFAYVAPGGVMLRDTFSGATADGWTMSPLGGAAGWSVASGFYTYNGSGHSLSYRGATWWSDYTVSAKVRLSNLSNYPGGIRGRIDPATGAGYVLWMYPATRELRLFRATAWFIDSPGLTQLGVVGSIPFDTVNFHTLRMTFRGSIIDVYYDGTLVLSATDAAYTSGVIALDAATQPIQFDDVTVWFGTPAVSALTVAPPTATFPTLGGTQQLRITGIGSDGNSTDVTADPSTTYSSSNPAVAQVSTTGLVTAVANGVARIDIKNGSGSTSAQVTVDTTIVTVTGISPVSGTTAGGNTVQISGSGFTAGSTVTIGGAAATNVVVSSGTQLSAVTPAGPPGRVNVAVSTGSRTASLANAFTYLPSGNTVLLRDDFSSGAATGWTISPLGGAAGWSVVNGVYTYNGGGHTQSYRGDAWWSDYTLSVKFRLNTLSNYPGGIRGRVNTASGTSYAVWLYPSSREIKLFRTTGWNINSPGLTQLAGASGIPFDTGNFHNLRLTFRGSIIEAYYDGTLVLSATDTAYDSGVIALDVADQPIGFDDVTVWYGSGLTNLGVTPSATTFAILGATKQLQVNGTWADGVSANLTADSLTSYASSNMGVARVSATGLVTAIADGSARIDIRNADASTSTLVTVDSTIVSVTGITPARGSTAGGTTVQISGSGFTASTAVTIGGAPSTGLVVSSRTQLSAVTPSGSVGPADVVVSTSAGTASLTGGFTYLPPSGVLLQDSFSSGTATGWTISPLGGAAGWSVVGGVYTYNGGGHTQSYRGDAWWSDYTLSVKFRLGTLSNFPGGIRGRVNPSTGASYAVWLYPATRELRLYRATGWNINSPGLTQIGGASGLTFDTVNFHTLRMTFRGAIIDVYYDGVRLLSSTDTAYASGVIALDVADQPIGFDDVAVTFDTLTAISPSSGPAAGGTTVNIQGSGFTGGSAVSIGGSAATGVVVNTDASITAMTPAGPPGPADVAVQTGPVTATLSSGFMYVPPAGAVLLSDDFARGNADGWVSSPLGGASGWSVVGGVYHYNGGGHTQSYRGQTWWSDYTLSVKIRLNTLSNYPGGIRGRVNPATGESYAVWLYPATREIRLYQAVAWNIDTPGLTQLGVATGIPVDTASFHTLSLTFRGSVIQVYYDGTLVISASNSAYSTGVIALDVVNQPIDFANVLVTTP